MAQIRVMRSFVSTDAFADEIKKTYDVQGDISCKFFSKMLRTQDNDHYLVETDNGRYVARLYQHDLHLGRTEADYQFELEWLRFLNERGVSVSHPMKRADGSYLGSVEAPEGIRYYAVFSFASGKPMSLKDVDQLYEFGAHMAKIHNVSDEFQSAYARHPIDMKFLVDDSIERIRKFWKGSRMDDVDLLLTSANEAREEIEALLGDTTSNQLWGVIGGDFHNSNTHVNDAGQPTSFNFDLCGYGWRAYDIAAFLSNTRLIHSPSEYAEAFFAGYYSERPLSPEEHQAISPFLTIRRIWLTGTFSVNEGLVGHTFVGSV